MTNEQGAPVGTMSGPAPIEPLLSIEDLRFEYFLDKGPLRAVDGLRLDIATNEVVAVVGESGSGKSASALSVMRLVAKSTGRVVGGRVLFRGTDLLTLSDSAMRSIRGRHIAMIFQNPTAALHPLLTIGSQLEETANRHLNMQGESATTLAKDLLERLDVVNPERVLRSQPFQLSGGMNQRVMLALALIGRPELLIADEPTTMLDVITQAEILRLIERTQVETGMALWLITHDFGVVARMAQRVVVMYMGQPVETATATSLIESPSHPYTIALRDSVPTLDTDGRRLPQIHGQPPDPRGNLSYCRFATRCKHVMEICRTQEPPQFVAPHGGAVKCWLYG
jgi:oligopeptide/dipeptide ABC transporter ATP-binding protein